MTGRRRYLNSRAALPNALNKSASRAARPAGARTQAASPRPNLFVLKKKKYVSYYQLKKQKGGESASVEFAVMVGRGHDRAIPWQTR
jgi:hypothetical protein